MKLYEYTFAYTHILFHMECMGLTQQITNFVLVCTIVCRDRRIILTESNVNTKYRIYNIRINVEAIKI